MHRAVDDSNGDDEDDLGLTRRASWHIQFSHKYIDTFKRPTRKNENGKDFSIKTLGSLKVFHSLHVQFVFK